MTRSWELRLARIVPIFLLLSVSMALSAQPNSSSSSSNPALETAPQAQNDRGFARATQSKVGNDLLALSSTYSSQEGENRPASAFTSASPGVRMPGGMVAVDAVAEKDTSALQAELRKLGMQNIEAYGRIVSGYLPIAAIEKLNAVASLHIIRASYSTLNFGLATTQGDVATRSDDARANFGVDGNGVIVGTLSDSYNCLNQAPADVSTYDLPTGISVLQDEPGCASGTDEGRAMMQIIHDLAPGASQAFHTAFVGQAGFANGILELANTAGADVIVDDVTFFNEPWFQDGPIAQAVDQVNAQGVAYFTSAGNRARDSYESVFTPGSSPITASRLAHDFNPGAGIDVRQNITVPVGATVTVVLQWDSPFFSVSGPPGSPNDLDIYLLDSDDNTLASGANNNTGGDATEFFSYYNDGTEGTSFNIVIEKFAGPDPGFIKYIIFRGGTINEYDTNSGTIVGHHNAAGAVAIGAAAYFATPEYGINPPVLESFSSREGAPILFDTSGNSTFILRQKPELTCVDGGNTTFFGQDFEPDGYPNFFGTSAAAPHAAAIAALMLEGDPNLTPAQILGALESTAIDMGSAGYDNESGYGLCQANLAVPAAADPDSDDVLSVNDNCAATSNPDQEDMDADDVGNLCDPDVDGDGINNVDDPDDDNDQLEDADEAAAGGNPVDPDTDNDTVIDGLDRDPDDSSNVLASCISPNATFNLSISSMATCAATTSITAPAPAAVTTAGNLLMISPRVTLGNGFSVELGGEMHVVSRDPTDTSSQP